jgi:hypothetical protein
MQQWRKWGEEQTMLQSKSFFQRVKESVHDASNEHGVDLGDHDAAQNRFLQYKDAARNWSQGCERGITSAASTVDSRLTDRDKSRMYVSTDSLASVSSDELLRQPDGPFSSPAARNAFETDNRNSRATSGYKRATEPTKLARSGAEVATSKGDCSSALPKLSTTRAAVLSATPSGSWSERILAATGITLLSETEYKVFFAVLFATPLVLLVAEHFVRVHRGSALPGSGAWTQLLSMSWYDVQVSILLGVLLSIIADPNTAATDRMVLQWWNSFKPTIVNESEPAAIQKGSLASTLSSLASSPFVRLLVAALVLGYVLKVAASAAVITAVHVSSKYGVVVVGLLCVAATAYLCYLVGSWYLRRSRVRSGVVTILATKTKAMLVSKGRAYPISYLYEEIADEVKLAQLGVGDSALLLSPAAISRPVAVLGSSNYLGESGSAVKSAVNGTYPTGNVTEYGGESARTWKQDVLKGYKLRQLWGEVQRAVQADSRVQRLDIIVDGRKQACWRILTASTTAGI